MKTTPLAHSCADAAQLGMYDNGFYTLHDTSDKKYTAYCDFTSEPGFAWTLILSFSRHIVRTEPSQVSKQVPPETVAICLSIETLEFSRLPVPNSLFPACPLPVPCLYLPVPACTCLYLPVPACTCLYLPVPACTCLKD